jgi:hypothetical protein
MRRTMLVMLAFLAMLLVVIAISIARDRAHQLPLGNDTLGPPAR